MLSCPLQDPSRKACRARDRPATHCTSQRCPVRVAGRASHDSPVPAESPNRLGLAQGPSNPFCDSWAFLRRSGGTRVISLNQQPLPYRQTVRQRCGRTLPFSAKVRSSIFGGWIPLAVSPGVQFSGGHLSEPSGLLFSTYYLPISISSLGPSPLSVSTSTYIYSVYPAVLAG